MPINNYWHTCCTIKCDHWVNSRQRLPTATPDGDSRYAVKQNIFEIKSNIKKLMHLLPENKF